MSFWNTLRVPNNRPLVFWKLDFQKIRPKKQPWAMNFQGLLLSIILYLTSLPMKNALFTPINSNSSPQTINIKSKSKRQEKKSNGFFLLLIHIFLLCLRANKEIRNFFRFIFDGVCGGFQSLNRGQST